MRVKLFVSLLFFNIQLSYSQKSYNKDFWRHKFDSTLFIKNKINSISSLLNNSKTGNSFLFMNLSYPFDGLLTMFESTNDYKYLRICDIIIKNLINSSHLVIVDNKKYPAWTADSTDLGNKYVQGKEVILFEGYIIRYIAQYCYLLSQRNTNIQQLFDYNYILNFVKGVFLKWYYRSEQKFGDDSLLQAIRIHMGSHWAATAFYLYRMEEDKKEKQIYLAVFSKYDKALRKNLTVVIDNKNEYYTWNSTWTSPVVSIQRGEVQHVIPQDISHSNQVVRYIIDCYAIDSSFWKRKDMELLVNTLKLRILRPPFNKLPDNINGTYSLENKLKGSGWRQSDGWVRLTLYDTTLFDSYLKMFSQNSFLDRSLYSLQYFAVFYIFLKNK